MSSANQTAIDPRLIQDAPGMAGAWAGFRRRVSQGELGSLPVIIGLSAIWIIFYLANERFLSAINLTNLMLQISAMGMISAGIVLILLLGETDLSAGAVSGLAAAVMTILNVKMHVPAVPALLAGLATGTAIGAFQGTWVTRFKVPSFVVTLAGSLAWQGALFSVLGSTGSVNLYDPVITGLTSTFFSTPVSWGVVAVIIGTYVGSVFLERRRRATLGLVQAPLRNVAFRMIIICGAVVAAVSVFTQDRGLPLATLIFAGVVVALELLLRNTRFGRHVFAVGGNAEAARRAGIRVEFIRITIFAMGSTLAAAGGMLAASRLLAVNQSSGSGDVLLNSIGAAVIGGTSLFGGRGSAWSAILGALVIGSIANGMDLLAFSSSVKFMVTGSVLLVAASVDAVSRRGRQAAGRA
ncbi:ribose transport system permease protein RbsC [Cystobacter fuscus DSM 2262]|uniref:Xylose transport system permease protein XylH n=1 Tax=Cystobacter fuscus (strain ATCC 25194 / DSM 2262 / NBRC 100088 / M29) TaxID=1242864 RepID=S9Q7W7_CYSF2|nr:ribose ABC transporter permease [Cystobacter fuscus]EPX57434.1 ribose transport system permease protein RbsC [Cystobacter fuscus DSM 2262]